jgi:hypothetical protein
MAKKIEKKENALSAEQIAQIAEHKNAIRAIKLKGTYRFVAMMLKDALKATSKKSIPTHSDSERKSELLDKMQEIMDEVDG